jgi:hypothetical protein
VGTVRAVQPLAHGAVAIHHTSQRAAHFIAHCAAQAPASVVFSRTGHRPDNNPRRP